MGLIDRHGNEMGTAAQDVYWRSVLPGYEGSSSSFAVPGSYGAFAGDMRNRQSDLGQELSGPNNWFGAIQGDRHLMSNMTKGLSEEDAYLAAKMIDSGELDHLGYGAGRHRMHTLFGQGWTGKKKKEEEKAAASPRSAGGVGYTAPTPITPRPWSPFPDQVT